jgi:enoyl-CoA hydratase/carnithine racemase
MSGNTPQLTKLSADIACILLRRPDSANRIELEDLNTIKAHVRECEVDNQTKVLIFSSTGKYFSAGLDLNALKTLQFNTSSHSQSSLEEVMNLVANTKLITIASIQGPVFGGATDLALACDLRIGTHDCFIQMPAAKFGLALYPSLIDRYISNLGLTQAKRIILTGLAVQADELISIGFLTELVLTENLEVKTFELAKEVAEYPFKPLSAMKKYMNYVASFDQDNNDYSKKDLINSFDINLISERTNINRT